MKADKITKRKRADIVLDVDVFMWQAGVEKLSLKESGELIRALTRAKTAKRPNRDQRMLLAVFTRNPNGVAP